MAKHIHRRRIPSSDSEERASRAFVERGKELIVQRRFLQAARECRLGLLSYPRNVEGRLVLGTALMALGRHEQVLAEMKVVLDLDSNNAVAYRLKGEALFECAEYAKAWEVLFRALQLDPNNKKIRDLLAEIEEKSQIDETAGEEDTFSTKVYPARLDDPDSALSEGSTLVDSDTIRGKGLEPSSGTEEFDTDPFLEPLPSPTSAEKTEVGEETIVDDGPAMDALESPLEHSQKTGSVAGVLPPRQSGDPTKLIPLGGEETGFTGSEIQAVSPSMLIDENSSVLQRKESIAEPDAEDDSEQTWVRFEEPELDVTPKKLGTAPEPASLPRRELDPDSNVVDETPLEPDLDGATSKPVRLSGSKPPDVKPEGEGFSEVVARATMYPVEKQRTATIEENDSRVLPFGDASDLRKSSSDTGHSQGKDTRNKRTKSRSNKSKTPHNRRTETKRKRNTIEERPSFVSLFVGRPGSYRWVFLLGIAITVAVAAWTSGRVVKYFLLGDQLERNHKAAIALLQKGNLPDFNAAIEIYNTILRKSPDHASTLSMRALVEAAIPVEFGVRGPNESAPEGLEGEFAEAAAVYRKLAEGKLREAADRTTEARRQFPHSALLLYLQGKTDLLLGKADSAVAFLERAHQLEPQDAMTLSLLGDGLAAEGDVEGAGKRYGQALKVNSDHVASLLSSVRVLKENRAGNSSDALSTLTSIIEGSWKEMASKGQLGWAHLLAADLMLATGTVEVANTHVQKARDNKPINDPVFLDEFCGVLIEMFKLDEAETLARESTLTMPGRPHPHFRMAQVFLSKGRVPEALEEAKNATILSATRLLRGRIYIAIGNLAAAREEADAAFREMPGLNTSLLNIEVLMAEGKLSEAEKTIRDLLAKYPGQSKLLATLGDINVKQGNLAAAESTLQQVVKLNPHHVGALRNLAMLDYGRWNLADAKSNLLRILEIVPNDKKAILTLVKVLIGERDYENAKQKLAQLGGGNLGAVGLANGLILLSKWDPSGAVQALRQAITFKDLGPEPWDLLVRAYLEANNGQKAFKTAQEMESEFPGSPESSLTTGRIYLNQGNAKAAIGAFKTAIARLNPSSQTPVFQTTAYVLLGRAYSEAGRSNQGLVQFDRAAEICGKCAEPVFYKGIVLDEKGRILDSIAALTKAIALDPKWPEPYYELGKAYDNNGQIELAINKYREYLDFDLPRELKREAQQALKALVH
ncbi:MAG: tetratricopeptide repeat protein [Pseudomonadota bacterium]